MKQKEKLNEVLKEGNSILSKFKLDNNGNYKIDRAEITTWLKKIKKFTENESDNIIKKDLEHLISQIENHMGDFDKSLFEKLRSDFRSAVSKYDIFEIINN